MALNKIVPFAQAGGANVQTQTDYEASTSRTNGNQPGVASAPLNNKALRQATAIAVGVAQFLADYQATDVDDSLTGTALSTMIRDALRSGLSEPGRVIAFAGSGAPSGRWLKCNGQAVARTGTYAALFNVIGTTYGVGDGATTFNLPDLRGEFVRGLDESRGVDTGRALGTFQADAIKNHTHPYGSTHQTSFGMDTLPNSGVNPANQVAYQTGNNVGGTTETRPRNVAMPFYISY